MSEDGEYKCEFCDDRINHKITTIIYEDGKEKHKESACRCCNTINRLAAFFILQDNYPDEAKKVAEIARSLADERQRK